MVPTKLTLSNFMCYRADGAPNGPPSLVFDGLHVVCLSGENGAGKSALLDAITWALWGRARMADDDLIAQGQGEMSVDLEFQLGEQQYRIIRRRQRGTTTKRGSQNAGKSQLDFQVFTGEVWRPLGEIRVTETQAAISGLLRMSYQTFINAAFLLQGRADEFTARTPSERKEVLADILDLGEYEALATRAKERAKGFADRLTGLRGTIEQLQQSADQLRFWQQSAQEAADKAAQIEQQVDQAEQAKSAAEAELRNLEKQADERKALLRELEGLRKTQVERERELAELRGRIAAAEKLVSRRELIERGVADLAEARAALDQLEHLREQHDVLAQRQAELRQRFTEAKHELRQSLSALEQRRDALQKLGTRCEQIHQEIAAFDLQLVAMGPLETERKQCAEEREALAQRFEQSAELRRRHEQLEGRIKLRQDSLVGVREEQLRIMRSLDQQLADEPRWREELAAAEQAATAILAEEARLSTFRAEEQREVDVVSHQRAECSRLKAAADKLKANQKLLAEAGASCPVCRNDLGSAGVAHVQAHYESELRELRAAYSEAKRQADQGDTQVKAVRANLGVLERRLAELRGVAAQVEPLMSQLRQVEHWRAERDAAQKAYLSAQDQLDAKVFDAAAQAELATVAAELAVLGEPNELTRQRKRLDEQLRELDRRLRERDKVEGLRQGLQQERSRAETELVGLDKLLAELDELRRKLDENDFAHAIRNEGSEVSAAIAALGYSAETHSAAREQARTLERWTNEAQELRLAEQRLDADRLLLEQAEQLRQKDNATIEALTRADVLLEQALRELPRIQGRADELRTALQATRRNLNVAQSDLGEKRAYVKKAEQATAELAQAREDERALAERQGLFAELAEAFGKKGVQAMLIETAIPQIEDEANRLLGRMTDGQMHLSFEMQRDTKKGDTVETLEIKIADALGTRVYDAFSGGEAMRANFAVRIALSRLLARRAGARLETLVIDEGFGTLDAFGRERMVEAITSVQDDFRRIIVITHIDELKDRFPAQIEVVKTPLGSMWELR